MTSITDDIISLWADKHVNGLKIAERLWQFKEQTGDASVESLQQAFIARKITPPEAGEIAKYILVWAEWVVRRKCSIDVLARIGVERLYLLRSVPEDQNELWLERARTMKLRELLKAMGGDVPNASVKVHETSKVALSEALEYVKNALRQSLHADIELGRSELIEFMSEVFRTMSPTRIAALWKTLYGEAGVDEYLSAMKYMGQQEDDGQ